MQQPLGDRLLVRVGVNQRPQLRAQGSRGRLEQSRNIDIEGAEAHAQLSQGAARGLIERLHLRLDAFAFEDPERLRQFEREIAHALGNRFGLGEIDSGPSALRT